MRVERIDHFVLTVRDIETTCDFYSRVLGMEVEEFEGGRLSGSGSRRSTCTRPEMSSNRRPGNPCRARRTFV